MSDLCRLIWSAVIGLFRSRAALQAEVLFLRHQLNVRRRKSPRRVALNNIDRLEALIESFIELISQVFILPSFRRRTSC